MKKTLILAIAVSLLFAGIAFGGVLSSKHDMRLEDSTNAGMSTAVCEFCHHPHRGVAANRTNTLLWNKNYSSSSGYAPYAGTATLNGVPATLTLSSMDNNNYATALCMSCHDGVNAANSGVIRAVRGANTQGQLNLTYDVTASNLGTTLADDHPVNFTYTDSVNDDIPGPSDSVWSTYPLFGTTFQCATCHDVHNGSTESVQFLRGTNKLANSQICRDCHTAK